MWRSGALAKVEEQMKWAVLFALGLSFLTALRDVASMEERGRLDFWLWCLAAQLTLFLYWALLAPVVLYAMEWIGDRGWNRTQALVVHLVLYAILGTVFYAFVTLVNTVLWPWPSKTAEYPYFLRWSTFWAVFLNSALKYYVPVLLGGAIYRYNKRVRAEEVKGAQLREQLSESQFRLLKMQLHPHFLFNALHSISTLIYIDPTRADRMISELSELLRLSLESTDVVMVPLREELHYVRKYLDIERIRFSDRLEVKYSIAPGTLSVEVPNLILQPLVENAIKHGMSKQSSGGLIHVMAYKQRGGLILAVEDNGAGFDDSEATGIGTRNVRERLQRLYAHRARMSLINIRPRGARQELFIPIDDINALFETLLTEFGTAT